MPVRLTVFTTDMSAALGFSGSGSRPGDQTIPLIRQAHAGSTEALGRLLNRCRGYLLRIARKEPAELTGQALVDEDFLRAEGVTDFGCYACVPGSQPPRLSWAAFSKG